MTDQALLDALDRLRGTGPEFNGFLANHGPMAAEALTRLGGFRRRSLLGRRLPCPARFRTRSSPRYRRRRLA